MIDFEVTLSVFHLLGKQIPPICFTVSPTLTFSRHCCYVGLVTTLKQTRDVLKEPQNII